MSVTPVWYISTSWGFSSEQFSSDRRLFRRQSRKCEVFALSLGLSVPLLKCTFSGRKSTNGHLSRFRKGAWLKIRWTSSYLTRNYFDSGRKRRCASARTRFPAHLGLHCSVAALVEGIGLWIESSHILWINKPLPMRLLQTIWKGK